jgi:N-acetylmuramoyl-L-alanine amidase
MWERIIIHHSLTKDGAVVDWQAIRRYHMSWAYCGNIVSKEEANELIGDGKRVKRPWTNIGYHYGIEKINSDYEILVGRQLNQIGAHTRGHNQESLGICLVGNYDIDIVGDSLLRVASKLVKSHMSIFNISPNNVFGHNEFNSHKTCPGSNFNMEAFRNKLR